jgi:hypothetical protein
MAKLYRASGSLSNLLSEFKKEKITFFNSLSDVISFRDEFQQRLSKIKGETTRAVLLEKEELGHKNSELSAEYSKKIKEQEALLIKEKAEIESSLSCLKEPNIFLKPFYIYKQYKLKKRLETLSINLEAESKRAFKNLNNTLLSVQQELHYMEQSVDKIIEERARIKSRDLYTAKSLIEENTTTLLGAIGEEKTIKELSTLPDSFFVINDFQYEFDRPLHNKSSNDWIRSIQVDHIVIGPSGVFVIETKNWSRNSIQSTELYSPVQQIRRINYALFFLLNHSVTNNLLPSFNDNWGSRKISVNSIVLLVNTRPNQEFQYVKLLSLNNLRPYLTYLKPVLTENETEQITEFLLQRAR